MIGRPMPGLLAFFTAGAALGCCLLAAGCRGSGSATGTGTAAGPAEPAAASTPPAADSRGDAHRPAAREPTLQPNSESPNAMSDPVSAARPDGTEVITLGAGCFWCIEAVLDRVDGVVSVESGYMGGSVEHPTYDQVCSGDTGHAEVVQVRFDPAKLPLRALLDWFFKAHDPTTMNRQGNDYGTQYRSAIFYRDEPQRRVAEQAKAAAQEHYGNVVTEITAASTFWPAEAYHQDYFAKNPNQGYCRAIIPPKLQKLGLDQKAPNNKPAGK